MGDWSRPFSSAWRWVRVSRATGYEVATVGNVTTGSLSINADSDSFESANIECIGPLEVGTDLLRCYLDATWEDGTVETVCVGTWLASVPSRDVSGSYESCTATLDGRLVELQQDAFDAPLTLARGTDAVAYAKRICEGCGLEVVQLDEVSAPLGAPWAFAMEPNGDADGGSKLAAVNALLTGAGMRAASTDPYGRVVFRKSASQPYAGASWTFAEGAGATFLGDATDERDSTEVANVVHAIYETADATTVGTAIDASPASPYSTVSVGRRIVRNYTYNDTATQAAANAKAANLLASQQSVIRRVTVSHVRCPLRVGDVAAIDYPSAGISGTFLVRTQEVELGGAGALTRSELRRYER